MTTTEEPGRLTDAQVRAGLTAALQAIRDASDAIPGARAVERTGGQRTAYQVAYCDGAEDTLGAILDVITREIARQASRGGTTRTP